MSQSAVVRIFATSQDPDHDCPWQARTPHNGTGSGVVIGDGQILTGAHVVANATFLQVQKISDPNKAIATGDPMDKAGAYAIQHDGFDPVARRQSWQLVERLEAQHRVGADRPSQPTRENALCCTCVIQLWSVRSI